MIRNPDDIEEKFKKTDMEPPSKPEQTLPDPPKPVEETLKDIDPEFLVQSEQKRLKKREKRKKLQQNTAYQVSISVDPNLHRT